MILKDIGTMVARMMNAAANLINKTVLWAEHQKLNAKMADFAGFHMPINYGSQINEHLAVRNDAGVFDVSHMVVIDITGADATRFLEWIITNDVNKLALNKALYTCMCNEHGGIIDDLIVYKLADQNNHPKYRLVVNAGTWQKDLQWLNQHKKDFDIDINKHNESAILAVQGPQAIAKLITLLSAENQSKVLALKNFEAVDFCEQNYQQNIFIARTGYTGEDGVEIILPNQIAVKFWQDLLRQNISPCGLGARDTLRLEAGLNLYGSDMDESVTPLEAGIFWTVDAKSTRDFIGRQAVVKQKTTQDQSNNKTKMIGLILDTRGVLRHDMQVIIKNNDKIIGEGVITSGTYSPTLELSIAMCRVNFTDNLDSNNTCEVKIRDKWVPVKIVSYPFVRFNKAVYKNL